MKRSSITKRALFIRIGIIAGALCVIAAGVFFTVRYIRMHDLGPVGTAKPGATAVRLMWDVSADHPSFDQITSVVRYGVVKCYPDGSYKPDVPATRSEFAGMAARMAGIGGYSPGVSEFRDVTPNLPDYDYIEAVKGFFITTEDGTDKYFKPNDPIRREEAAVVIAQAAGLDAKKADLTVLDGLSDRSGIDAAMKPYVALCIKNGSMPISGGVFNPQGSLTRAEAAVLLKAFVEIRFPTAGATFEILSIN